MLCQSATLHVTIFQIYDNNTTTTLPIRANQMYEGLTHTLIQRKCTLPKAFYERGLCFHVIFNYSKSTPWTMYKPRQTQLSKYEYLWQIWQLKRVALYCDLNEEHVFIETWVCWNLSKSSGRKFRHESRIASPIHTFHTSLFITYFIIILWQLIWLLL